MKNNYNKEITQVLIIPKVQANNASYSLLTSPAKVTQRGRLISKDRFLN